MLARHRSAIRARRGCPEFRLHFVKQLEMGSSRTNCICRAITEMGLPPAATLTFVSRQTCRVCLSTVHRYHLKTDAGTSASGEQLSGTGDDAYRRHRTSTLA